MPALRAACFDSSGVSRMFPPREFEQASFDQGAWHSSAVKAYRLVKKVFRRLAESEALRGASSINPLTASQQLSLSQCSNTAPTTHETSIIHTSCHGLPVSRNDRRLPRTRRQPEIGSSLAHAFIP